MCNAALVWPCTAPCCVSDGALDTNTQKVWFPSLVIAKTILLTQGGGSYFRWCNGAVAADLRPQGRLFINSLGKSQCPLQRPKYESPQNQRDVPDRKSRRSIQSPRHEVAVTYGIRKSLSRRDSLTGRHTFIRRQPSIAGGEQTQS